MGVKWSFRKIAFQSIFFLDKNCKNMTFLKKFGFRVKFKSTLSAVGNKLV